MKAFYITAICIVFLCNCCPHKVVKKYKHITTEYCLLNSKDFSLLKFLPLDSTNAIILYKNKDFMIGSYFNTIIGNAEYDSASYIGLLSMRGDFQDTFQYWNNQIIGEFERHRLSNKNKIFIIYKGNMLKKVTIKQYNSTKSDFINLTRWYYMRKLLYEFESVHS